MEEFRFILIENEDVLKFCSKDERFTVSYYDECLDKAINDKIDRGDFYTEPDARLRQSNIYKDDIRVILVAYYFNVKDMLEAQP